MPVPLKMGHPSFFHCLDLTRGDDGSLHGDERSSLSEFVGTVFALPGEPGLFLNVGTPQNNRSGPSSNADICRNLSHTNDTEYQLTKKMASNLPTVRSHDKDKLSLLSFRLSAGLCIKARSCCFGLFFILSIVQENQQKNQPTFYPESKRWAKKPCIDYWWVNSTE